MDRYICIHCHFYQPPRENPWLEAVELQDSAYPYHDWNERITAECYAPNSASRILDGTNHITQIVNNYGRISFNFGPTLLSWMEDKAPDIYERILQADLESRERFSGHGSAMAQAYNHMILPLANRRDRETQVHWGVRDFQKRFGRDPEGMWLPEAAVDTETLEVLADAGIKFTVLAPHQAKQARLRRGTWKNVEGGRIDPTKAYLCRLPSGKLISLFFYDGPISRAVAFEGLLSNGEQFAQRLLGGFDDTRKWPQLMHIATDGETYGHHHRHGDMALAYALHYIESKGLAKLTNYGEYLAKHPPTTEAEIIDNTSWSCVHGVERWRSDCGCNSGMKPAWRQAWRAPLRSALDALCDELAAPFEQAAASLLKSPWDARDEYIRLVLDRGPDNVHAFFTQQAHHELNPEETIRALKLLEMQRHLMLMYTSCGWFFDDLSGIETVQVIFYAGRALQLAQDVFGDHLEEHFLERLAEARSNLAEIGAGSDIYRRWVKPAVVNLLGVGAHYAISSMFDDYGQRSQTYCYEVERQDYHREQAGRAHLAAGHVRITSQITLEQADISFGVVHLGDHNLNAGVRPFLGEAQYGAMVHSVISAFERADLPAALRAVDKHFPENSGFSIKSLFRDEQRRILDQIMKNILGEAEASYRGIYDTHAPMMRFLAEVNMPLPRVLQLTAEFVLNGALRRELNAEEPAFDRVAGLVEAARRDHVALDAAGLGYVLRQRLDRMMQRLLESPRDPERLRRMATAVRFARSLQFEVDLWQVQNLYWELLETVYPDMRNLSDPDAQDWAERFLALGADLGIRVEAVAAPLPLAA